MALGWIIVYGHPNDQTPAARRRFERALFGYVDRSKNGQYAYERRGVLTDAPHVVLARGALLVPLELKEAVTALMREHGVDAWTRRVELTVKEARRLYPVA